MLIGATKVPGTRGFNIGFELSVAWSMEMPTEDLSGNTSLTDKADKGIKPKRLSINFALRENKSELEYWTRFLLMLEAKDSKGQAIEYVVIHPLVQASRIRTMRVVGQVRIAESTQQRRYDVSFELEEVRSVPEASEARSQTRASGTSTNPSFEAALKKIESKVKS